MFVGGAGVLVGGTGVLVGGTGVLVGGTAPVPLSWTFCGLVRASSTISRLALRLPAAAGRKPTAKLQLPPGATVAPAQPSELMIKLPVLAPVKVTPAMCKGTRPLLARVIVCAALLVPTI